jgi:preprotein translocase subunit SecD
LSRLLGLFLLATAMISCASGRDRDATFFQMRPVLQQLGPDQCTTERAALVTPAGQAYLPEKSKDGATTSCHLVGPTGLSVVDVASAKAVSSPATGFWQIDMTLTAAGTKRFNDLAAKLGVGNRIALVVDGVVISAPRLETTSFAGRLVMTGNFTRAEAEALAARLRA